jgi:hypothetical protein
MALTTATAALYDIQHTTHLPKKKVFNLNSFLQL